MDRAAFLQRALEIVKEARPFDASVIDEGRFAVVSVAPDGGSRLTSLANFWSEYTAADTPQGREAVLDKVAGSAALMDSGESFDEIRVLLMPRLRSRAMFEIDMKASAEAILPAGVKAPPFFYRPVAEHLGVGLAIDRPDHVQYITDVSEYPHSGDELMDIALDNLRRATKTGFRKLEEGLWVGDWKDDFAPERLLLDALFSDFPPEFMVFLPGSEKIYVADSRDRSALSGALEIVEERLEEPRCLVPFALWRQEGQWRVVDDPRFPRLSERLTAYLAPRYKAQREAYMAAREESGDADMPFCSSILPLPSEQGDHEVSMCLWTKGQDTLLPRTDVVQVVDLDRQAHALVTWRRFRQLCGACVSRVPDMYPFRYRTVAFPSDEALTELAEQSYKPVAPRERERGAEASFRPLTEPEPPELGATTDWTSLSPKTVFLGLIGIAGVYVACRLIDQLSGCG